MHVGRRTDLHPVAILRKQKPGGVIGFPTVTFKESSFYKVNPERISGNAILELKMPKMALADCSGVDDAVIAKPPDC